ncbi:hypothetical protein AB3S75_030451 [Citrus x aurantiifolia]
MKMEALRSIHSSDLWSLCGRAFSFTRSQPALPEKLFFCRAKFGDSGVNGSSSLRVVPSTLLAAEKEEAKAVLTLFLKKQGLSKGVAARTINKSDLFIDHLVSRLHSVHKSRYLVGRELTTLEIRDALTPYLESLLEEYGNVLVDLVENFPNAPAPAKQKAVAPVSPPVSTLDSKKLKAISRVSELDSSGDLRPQILYLIELGMDLEKIKLITRRFPAFSYYSLEGKIKPVVEFLLDLGIPKAQIPTILGKRPQLCGISLSENLIPTMTFLENLGVDKTQWAKVIQRFPAVLTYSRQKVKQTVDFLYEMGLSAESIVLLQRCPQSLGCSIEANLKPVTEFFLERGFTVEEIGTMISRFGALYTFSLTENLIPKWEFFLTMDYDKSELVKFPQYFGYSLEERIKPRYARVKVHGVKLLLNQVLSLSGSNFENVLKKKIEKALSDGGHENGKLKKFGIGST